MFDGSGKRLPPEPGLAIVGVRPELPLPFGNHEPPKAGTLLEGRVVGGVFPIEMLFPGRLDRPGNFEVWPFPKLGLVVAVGFVIVPKPRPLEGFPILIVFEPLPNVGLAGVNFPKLPTLPEVELLPVREDVPNLLKLGLELEENRPPVLREELENEF